MNDTVATIKVLHCSSAQHAACKHHHAIGDTTPTRNHCFKHLFCNCWLRQALLTAQYQTMAMEMCEFNT